MDSDPVHPSASRPPADRPVRLPTALSDRDTRQLTFPMGYPGATGTPSPPNDLYFKCFVDKGPVPD